MSLYASSDTPLSARQLSPGRAASGRLSSIFPLIQRPRTHYQLADSYRQLADQTHLDAKLDGDDANKGEETRQHALDEHLVNLTNAKDEFQKLADLLDQPEGRGC